MNWSIAICIRLCDFECVNVLNICDVKSVSDSDFLDIENHDSKMLSKSSKTYFYKVVFFFVYCFWFRTLNLWLGWKCHLFLVDGSTNGTWMKIDQLQWECICVCEWMKCDSNEWKCICLSILVWILCELFAIVILHLFLIQFHSIDINWINLFEFTGALDGNGNASDTENRRREEEKKNSCKIQLKFELWAIDALITHSEYIYIYVCFHLKIS